MKKPTFRYLSLALLFTAVFLGQVAHADDLFGDGDSAEEPEHVGSTPNDGKSLLGGLMGSPSEGRGVRHDEAWDDITTESTPESDREYEASIEVKMDRELSKDLPTREPFGDKLDDVEKRLGK